MSNLEENHFSSLLKECYVHASNLVSSLSRILIPRKKAHVTERERTWQKLHAAKSKKKVSHFFSQNQTTGLKHFPRRGRCLAVGWASAAAPRSSAGTARCPCPPRCSPPFALTPSICRGCLSKKRLTWGRMPERSIDWANPAGIVDYLCRYVSCFSCGWIHSFVRSDSLSSPWRSSCKTRYSNMKKHTQVLGWKPGSGREGRGELGLLIPSIMGWNGPCNS